MTSQAIAGAAGVGAALTGAGATATDITHVTAKTGGSNTIAIGSGGMRIIATGTPDADVNAIGVAVSGGFAVGVSVALAEADLDIEAGADAATTFTGGGLTIKALNTVAGGGDTASAGAIAAAGGFSVAANASVATAESSGSVTAYVGSSVVLPNGDILIIADGRTSQDATALGISAGYFAVGGNVSQASSGTATLVSIGDNVTTATSKRGGLSFSATGTDTNTADSTAGTGGIVAGNASVALTGDNSSAAVTLGNGVKLTSGNISIAAEHTDNYKAKANSINAAAVGASGAGADHDATTPVSVTIGNNVLLDARGSDLLRISAKNTFNQVGSGDSATAAAGGVFVGSAALSSADVTGHTAIGIGDQCRNLFGHEPGQQCRRDQHPCLGASQRERHRFADDGRRDRRSRRRVRALTPTCAIRSPSAARANCRHLASSVSAPPPALSQLRTRLSAPTAWQVSVLRPRKQA